MSVRGAGWREEHIQALETLVVKVNLITTQAYLLARFIFLRERNKDEAFDLRPWINAKFFTECFLSLTIRRRYRGTRSAATQALRAFITPHLEAFLAVSGFAKIDFPNGTPTAEAEGTGMATAYLNNVQERFGGHYRRFIDVSTGGKRAWSKETRPQLTRFKLAMATRAGAWTEDHPVLAAVKAKLDAVRAAYPPNYDFKKGSLFYDVKCNPLEHVNAFCVLAGIVQADGLKAFQAFPLRTSWIPAHTTVDTNILYLHVLGLSRRRATAFMELNGKPTIEERKKMSTRDAERGDLEGKMALWREVANLESVRAWRGRDTDNMEFQGTITTDGVVLSIVKQNFPSGFGNGPRKLTAEERKEKVQGVELLKKEDLAKVVLIDPNRRDLLYCMHYNSTVAEPRLYRYTQNQRTKETKLKHYRQIRDSVKPDAVKAAEAELSLHPLRTLDPAAFATYLRVRARVAPLLQAHYTTCGKSGQAPLHRKLRLAAHIKNEQSVRRLGANLRAKFGDDAKLVIGNWSAGNQRYHQPIKGRGMRDDLRKLGFDVYVLDEHLTSSFCPACEKRSVKPFKVVDNPRPFRRSTTPKTIRHGLLRCTTESCSTGRPFSHRLWNRDQLSVLNFRAIIHEHVFWGARPARFRRKTRQQNGDGDGGGGGDGGDGSSGNSGEGGDGSGGNSGDGGGNSGDGAAPPTQEKPKRKRSSGDNADGGGPPTQEKQ